MMRFARSRLGQLVTSGRVRIRELLDVVAAMGDDPKSVQECVRQVYDWQHARLVAGLQVTFAPAAAAVLAIVAKPDSTLVVLVALGVICIILVVGASLLLTLNWLHREYTHAVRLVAELLVFHTELAACPHGIGAENSKVADTLYNELGGTTMGVYWTNPRERLRVLDGVSRCHKRLTASTPQA